MDKQQNELKKSYIHARNQAVDVGSETYSDYEMNVLSSDETNPNGYPMTHRAKIYNEKIGEDKFEAITKFNLANKTIAVARLKNIHDEANDLDFINKNAEPTIDGVKTDEVKFNDKVYAAYINKKYKRKRNDFMWVSKNAHGAGVDTVFTYNGHALALDDDANISLDKIIDNKLFKGSFYSIFLNTYAYVNKFSYTNLAGADYIIARYNDGNIKLLDRRTLKPIKDIPYDKIDNMWEEERLAYFNQIQDEYKFKSISRFKDEYDGYSLAKTTDGEELFINHKGEKVDYKANNNG